MPCKQYFLCELPPTTSNLYRGGKCCTTHVAKATDVFSGQDSIFHEEQPPERVPTDGYFFSPAVASICCHRGRHRCDTVIHPCLQPTRSVFEVRFQLLRPSVRGTPSPTTLSEELLLRVGTLPFCTYLQPWRGTARGLQVHANSTLQAASNDI